MTFSYIHSQDYFVFLLVINGSRLVSALVVIKNIRFSTTVNGTAAVISESGGEMKKVTDKAGYLYLLQIN